MLATLTSYLGIIAAYIRIILCTTFYGLKAIWFVFVDFDQINLILFDECHVAIEPGSAYAALVDLLKQSTNFEDVRLFGMTSSIIGNLVEQPDELEKKINQLESVLAATGQWYYVTFRQ